MAWLLQGAAMPQSQPEHTEVVHLSKLCVLHDTRRCDTVRASCPCVHAISAVQQHDTASPGLSSLYVYPLTEPKVTLAWPAVMVTVLSPFSMRTGTTTAAAGALTVGGGAPTALMTGGGGGEGAAARGQWQLQVH
jgi:hypothetical protein